MKIIAAIFVVSSAIYAIYLAILKKPVCLKCNNKLTADGVKDRFSINITKNVFLSIFPYSGRDTYYKCYKCGIRYLIKSGTGEIIEEAPDRGQAQGQAPDSRS